MVLVALHIALELFVPVIRIRFGQPRVTAGFLGMLMPKTAVDKYNFVARLENQIRFSWQTLAVETEAVTQLVNQ
jgi:hypothetical protein